MTQKEDFLLKAYPLGIIKFGNYTLKSGIESPFYVDLRSLASSPQLLKTLSNSLLDEVGDAPFELICGVPYAALPMATTMSLVSGIPLIIKRKENKGYGTKKMLEGVFKVGQNCILVEDVITSGQSLLETIDEVEKEGLIVTDIVVVLDREHGGIALLEAKGYKVHTLFTINEVLDTLHKFEKLDKNEVIRVKNFLNENIFVPQPAPKKISYEEKERKSTQKIGKKILQLAIKKQSNLIASADLTDAKAILQFATAVGDSIVALKLHADIITDFTLDFIDELKLIAREKGFLLFEDRKFGDIGNTTKLQFEKGVHQIASWADMITVHVIAGEKSLSIFGDVGIVNIVEMSSVGTLTDENYIMKAIEISKNNKKVIGVVAQRSISADTLLFTPGVNLATNQDAMGQQYNTPEMVFERYHTDFIIVGRGIYEANDPAEEAKKYKKSGWAAYEKTLA